MHKQVRPERAFQRCPLVPALAAIGGEKDRCRGARGRAALRAEEIVRGKIITVGQNHDAGRTDVASGSGRAVVNDHAGHFWGRDGGQAGGLRDDSPAGVEPEGIARRGRCGHRETNQRAEESDARRQVFLPVASASHHL